MADDSERFRQELRTEIKQVITMVQTRLAVSDPEVTFSLTNVIATLYMVALECALHAGVSAERFITSMRASADQLEQQLQTRTGIFAPPQA